MNQNNVFPATIRDLEILEAKGPWTTKSDGSLIVSCSFDYETIMNFLFSHKERELDELPEDIRGFRMYDVKYLMSGKRGGNEYHRVRSEIVLGRRGKVKWEFEDVYGKKREFIMSSRNGFCLSPLILHSYEVLEDDSAFLVVCNTTFDPEEPRTHDTYNKESFARIQSMTLQMFGRP